MRRGRGRGRTFATAYRKESPNGSVQSLGRGWDGMYGNYDYGQLPNSRWYEDEFEERFEDEVQSEGRFREEEHYPGLERARSDAGVERDYYARVQDFVSRGDQQRPYRPSIRKGSSAKTDRDYVPGRVYGEEGQLWDALTQEEVIRGIDPAFGGFESNDEMEVSRAVSSHTNDNHTPHESRPNGENVSAIVSEIVAQMKFPRRLAIQDPTDKSSHHLDPVRSPPSVQTIDDAADLHSANFKPAVYHKAQNHSQGPAQVADASLQRPRAQRAQSAHAFPKAQAPNHRRVQHSPNVVSAQQSASTQHPPLTFGKQRVLQSTSEILQRPASAQQFSPQFPLPSQLPLPPQSPSPSPSQRNLHSAPSSVQQAVLPPHLSPALSVQQAPLLSPVAHRPSQPSSTLQGKPSSSTVQHPPQHSSRGGASRGHSPATIVQQAPQQRAAQSLKPPASTAQQQAQASEKSVWEVLGKRRGGASGSKVKDLEREEDSIVRHCSEGSVSGVGDSGCVSGDIAVKSNSTQESGEPSKSGGLGSASTEGVTAPSVSDGSSEPEVRQKPRPSSKYANGIAEAASEEDIDIARYEVSGIEHEMSEQGLSSEILDAVVKIYATHCDPNYSLPWQMRRQTQSTSSGFVISGRRILTNAHSVEHYTVVRVKKRAGDQKYIARVLATGNECDLALLTITDEEFWQDLKPLSFGTLPELQASVIVVGYPIGGENISVTAGVVSRVEIQDYTHGASQLLGIQIDAAINSGSSGGPALNQRNEVVGIAFQSLNTGDSENIGYLVAESVVDHFLRDYEKNGRYTGFCHCGFQWQRMENISLRRSMNMKDDDSGILVRRVNKTSPALKVLRQGDIITSIDDVSISNAGTVPYRSGERISFHYIITTKFTGDPVKLRILREGRYLDIEYELRESSENLLVPVHEHRRQPEYFTIAGLVFVALSEPYLAAEYGDKWDLKAPVRLLERLMYGSKETKDEQVVVLSQVLNAEINIGYEYLINTRVHKFNGERLRNLAHLARLVDACQDDYLRFDLDDEIVVVGREEAIKASQEILETHCIPSAHSIGELASPGEYGGNLKEVTRRNGAVTNSSQVISTEGRTERGGASAVDPNHSRGGSSSERNGAAVLSAAAVPFVPESRKEDVARNVNR